MSTKLLLLSVLLTLVACGDNIHPEGGPDDFGGISVPPVIKGDDVFSCADFDHITTCPDAGVPAPDAGTCDADVGDDDDGRDLKAACCHALEVNGKPPHECGFPPGLCKNGKRKLHCGDKYYELCNP